MDALGWKNICTSDFVSTIYAWRYTPQTVNNWCLSFWPRFCQLQHPLLPSFQRDGPFISPYSIFFRESCPMLATIPSYRENLRKCGTTLAIFANEGCGSFVYSLVTITVLACYKDVMEVVKRQREVNTTFWRQHCGRLIRVSISPSLENCRWPLPNCCVCYPLSPSHVTCVNSRFLISIPFLYPSHSPVIFQSVMWQ